MTERIPELKKEHVFIKNPDRLNRIIDNLVRAGHDQLQVVSDFDKTITKQHENGQGHISSFSLFRKCQSLSPEFLKTTSELYNKYGAIEIDPHIPYDEKASYMEQWWSESEIALRGLKVTQKEIQDVCLEYAPSLRNGSDDFFYDLNTHNVPVLIFSAGLGDVVVFVLKQNKVFFSNTEVVSNFLKYDNDGTILGFREKLIHVFNKNEYAIKGTDFYNKILNRDNVILMGDSLGDASMVDGIDHVTNVLKIGFLYEKMDEALPAYMDSFDIVLVDDQTMDIPKAILRLIDTAHQPTELATN